MKTAKQKIVKARTSLVLDEPFFGMLALRLQVKEDNSQPSAWVDGRTLGYNAKFIESLPHAELVGLIAHEVMHCAAGHPWRRDQRDPQKWNVACDHAINPILIDANFTLPKDALYSQENHGKSAEWIFDRLPEDQDDQGDEQKPEQSDQGEELESSPQAGGSGDQEGNADDSEGENENQDDDQSEGSDNGEDEGEGDTEEDDSESEGKGESRDDPQGEVRDAPADATEDGSTEGDWSAAVQQAANAAAAQGKLPGELKRFADKAVKTAVDWRSVMRRFMQEITRADYSWSQPNRRYMSQGLYMPALHSEELGEIVVAIDTSGSIDEVLLAQFEAEIRTIVDETNPSRVHVMYCDAEVHRTDEFESDDLIEFDPVGGGGTRFEPVFNEIENLGIDPTCVIYFTDLFGSFPKIEPDYPVLWAVTPTGWGEPTPAPFGEIVPVE